MIGDALRLAPRVAAHRSTTAHLGAAYPFVSDGGLGGSGVVVGRDMAGSAFAFDPFELYRQGMLTSPNMIVCGQIGRGKSAFVKTYLWRQSLFGRRSWVIDPKGEYGSLAAAWGVTPIRLAPGGDVRLNPLDLPSALPVTGGGRPGADEADRRRMDLLGALGAACLARPVRAVERAAIEIALTSLARAGSDGLRRRRCADAPGGPPTLPEVVDALLDPDPIAAQAIGFDAATLAAESRELALELRRLVRGDLRGMFDGPTSPDIALDASLVVLDLSAVYASDALGILIACATAWLEGARARIDGARGTLIVVDEAWAILSDISVARWLQSSWKLARAYGVSNIAVLHRLSDLRAAGAEGSQQAGLAGGLLSDSETRVIYAQAPGEVEAAREALSLTTTERDLLPRLGRGVALWKVADRSFLVRHILSASETALVDTDAAMVPPVA
ncbi:MAG: ATP-binding protein [Actinomycetota bacterium]|nr:ATP-binding protein [Actinomycetota bacterium]